MHREQWLLVHWRVRAINLFSHRHIVNVSQEVRNTFEGHGHITYHRCAVLDEESQNIYAFFRQTKHFIDEARNTGESRDKDFIVSKTNMN